MGSVQSKLDDLSRAVVKPHPEGDVGHSQSSFLGLWRGVEVGAHRCTGRTLDFQMEFSFSILVSGFDSNIAQGDQRGSVGGEHIDEARVELDILISGIVEDLDSSQVCR